MNKPKLDLSDLDQDTRDMIDSLSLRQRAEFEAYVYKYSTPTYVFLRKIPYVEDLIFFIRRVPLHIETMRLRLSWFLDVARLHILKIVVFILRSIRGER